MERASQKPLLNGGLAIGCVAFLLVAACNGHSTSQDDTTSETSASDQRNALLEAQKGCMTLALNNTIFKQQGDSALEDALFSQDLANCPTDFIEAYVALRNAARNYLHTARELAAHQGREEEAHQHDGGNFLCSIIVGAQCFDWETGKWNAQNSALSQQLADANAALGSAYADTEAVIARYGLYVRNEPASDSSADEAR